MVTKFGSHFLLQDSSLAAPGDQEVRGKLLGSTPLGTGVLPKSLLL
jgi:hypothetical protein